MAVEHDERLWVILGVAEDGFFRFGNFCAHRIG